MPLRFKWNLSSSIRSQTSRPRLRPIPIQGFRPIPIWHLAFATASWHRAEAGDEEGGEEGRKEYKLKAEPGDAGVFRRPARPQNPPPLSP
jgi:hypothetical protein